MCLHTHLWSLVTTHINCNTNGNLDRSPDCCDHVRICISSYQVKQTEVTFKVSHHGPTDVHNEFSQGLSSTTRAGSNPCHPVVLEGPMATPQEQSAMESPKPTYTISSSHKKKITCIAWLPDDRVVTGSLDKTIRIWNLTDGTQEGTSMVHDHQVRNIVATKDGRIVSCCDADEHLTVWNTDTQELVERARSNEEYGHPEMIMLSQNEGVLASCHRGGFVFWEMAETVRVRSHIRINEDNVRAPCLSPNGLRCVVFPGGNEREFSMFNLETGKLIVRFIHKKEIRDSSLAWSLDGGRFFCGDKKGQIHCFDSNTGDWVGKPWTGHIKRVIYTSLSPDGKWLASASLDETVRFWNVESGKPEGQPLPHGNAVHKIAFSHSGEFLASILVRASSTIFIWRVPWWHDHDQNIPNALLDMSAVVPPPADTSGLSNIQDLGFLDVSRPRRPLRPQIHSRENPSNGPPRAHDSVRSWQWWKRIPRLVFLRSHSIYMGRGPPRIAVASWENVENSQQSQSVSSSEENSEGSSDTPPAGLEVGELEVGCCGFLSRWQSGATAAQGRRHVRGDRSSRSDRLPTTENPGIPIPQPMHHATQDILELSAVVRSPDTS